MRGTLDKYFADSYWAHTTVLLGDRRERACEKPLFDIAREDTRANVTNEE